MNKLTQRKLSLLYSVIQKNLKDILPDKNL